MAGRAYQMAGEQQLHQSQINLGKLLVDLYSDTQQYQQALDISAANLGQVEAIKDQVLKLKLDEVSALNDVARTRAQLQFERQQNKLLAQNQRLTWTGIAILVPMLVLALFLLRSKQRLLKALHIQQNETRAALKAMQEAKELNEQLARTDPLTGLHNRRAMSRLLNRLPGEHTDHHLLMIDVDDFKSINDQHGHATGDEVLTGLADLFRELLPEHSTAARWGGEEFLILLATAESAEAIELAEQLRQSAASRPVGGSGIQVTISLGLSAWQNADNIDQWIHQADQALYDSKHSGKNKLTVFSGN